MSIPMLRVRVIQTLAREVGMNWKEDPRTISFNGKGLQKARAGFTFPCSTQGLKLSVPTDIE